LLIYRFATPRGFEMLNRYSIKRGDLVLDIGANIGYVSSYFLDRGANVVAFEPNPHARALLKSRLGSHPNLSVRDSAVSTTSGTARLDLHERHGEDELTWSTGSSLLQTKTNVSEDFVEVTTDDILSVLYEFPTVKLMKIDVEGTAYELLEKIVSARNKPEYVICETHHQKNPDLKPKYERVQNLLAEYGLSSKWTMDWT